MKRSPGPPESGCAGGSSAGCQLPARRGVLSGAAAPCRTGARLQGAGGTCSASPPLGSVQLMALRAARPSHCSRLSLFWPLISSKWIYQLPSAQGQSHAGGSSSQLWASRRCRNITGAPALGCTARATSSFSAPLLLEKAPGEGLLKH